MTWLGSPQVVEEDFSCCQRRIRTDVKMSLHSASRQQLGNLTPPRKLTSIIHINIGCLCIDFGSIYIWYNTNLRTISDWLMAWYPANTLAAEHAVGFNCKCACFRWIFQWAEDNIGADKNCRVEFPGFKIVFFTVALHTRCSFSRFKCGDEQDSSGLLH